MSVSLSGSVDPASWQSRFLATFAATLAAMLLGWAALAAALDPYDLLGTRIAGPRELGHDKRLMGPDGDRALKAIAIADQRRDIDTLIIGSSRAMMGFDPASPALSSLKAYNAGLPALRFSEGTRVLGYALQERARLRQVIWALDFDLFFLPLDMQVDFDRSGFARRPVREAYQRYLFSTKAALALLKAVGIGRRAERHVESKGGLLDGGFLERDAEGQRQLLAREALGLYPQFVRERSRFTEDLERHVRELRIALLAAAEHGVSVALVIVPIQIWRRELIDMAGLSPAFEAWKRRLAAVAMEAAALPGVGAVALWDFAHIHPITTEPPPTRMGDPPLRLFWEGSHFRPQIGDLMIQRMFAVSAESEGFGHLLTQATLEYELARDRAAYESWKAQHPTVRAHLTALVREITHHGTRAAASP